MSKESKKRTNKSGSYISATVNGVVRLDQNTPDKIQGLMTKSVKTCMAIIITNKDKISLMHFHIGLRKTLSGSWTQID